VPGQARRSPRPLGLSVLAILCALNGLSSLASAVQLFPEWLAAAKQHHYGRFSFTWVGLGAAVSGLAAAYGLWQRRRWARIPFVVSAVLAVVTACLITMFAVGEIGTSSGWVAGGLLLAVNVAVAGWLVRYVWRST